jgi:hypothetical protein
MGDTISKAASKGWFGVVGEMIEDKTVGKKEEKKNEAAGDAVRQKEAEATALAEKAAEEKKSKRASLLGATTSGFGANTNLARSFLTSL